MQDCPGRQRNLVPAFGALLAPLVHQLIRPLIPASWTGEPLRPTARRQILLARLFGGEVGLKLAQRFWGTAARPPLYTTPSGFPAHTDKPQATGALTLPYPTPK